MNIEYEIAKEERDKHMINIKDFLNEVLVELKAAEAAEEEHLINLQEWTHISHRFPRRFDYKDWDERRAEAHRWISEWSNFLTTHAELQELIDVAYERWDL